MTRMIMEQRIRLSEGGRMTRMIMEQRIRLSEGGRMTRMIIEQRIRLSEGGRNRFVQNSMHMCKLCANCRILVGMTMAEPIT